MVMTSDDWKTKMETDGKEKSVFKGTRVREDMDKTRAVYS